MKPPTTYSHTRNPHSSSSLMSASEMDFSETQGKPIKCTAMVARGVNDMKEEEITVDVPKRGEVRVKVRISHSKQFELDIFLTKISFT